MKRGGYDLKVPNTIPDKEPRYGIKVIRYLPEEPPKPKTTTGKIISILEDYDFCNRGIDYESDYSYWAKAIPDYFYQKYEELKNKPREEMGFRDIGTLIKIKDFLKLASLQKKYDEDILDDEEEYLRYLYLRLRFYLSDLRFAKVSIKEREEAEELLKQTDYMISLYKKDKLTILEKYLIEERNQEVFERSMLKTSMEIGERLRRINAQHAAMERDFYNNKF